LVVLLIIFLLYRQFRNDLKTLGKIPLRVIL
jgi:hypothetical protein